ncbi:RCC1 domain-containing protein [Pseudomonas sp. MDT1-16]
MLKQPKKRISPLSRSGTLALLEPEIPDRTLPDLSSGEWGINHAAARGVFPDKGLQVHVAPWVNMSKGDKVELLLNDKQVDQHTIGDTDVDVRSTLFVAPRHLLTGAYTLYYRVLRLGQNPPGEESAKPRLFAKLEIPGGQDTDPAPGHSGLFMFIDPKIVNDGVDKETAENGVPIIIRAESGIGVPYPDAAVDDVIVLSWGGVLLQSAPLTAKQISDPANNPIRILVEKATIEKAGDTDGLAVTFRVRDKVNNYSEDWCREARIKVSLDAALLAPPIVKEAVNNVLDLDSLLAKNIADLYKLIEKYLPGLTEPIEENFLDLAELSDKPVTIQVWANEEKFKIGDSITVTLRGTTLDGEAVEISAQAVTVDNVPHTYDVPLDQADVRKLVKTQAIFSYQLKRDGVPDQRSKGQFVQINGEPTRLAAPIAEHAEGGAIDPDLTSTRIRIPHDPQIEVGMGIELKWFGTRPNGSIYDPELDWYMPDREEVVDPNGFFFTVEGRHLKTLEGGNLVLSYNLLIDEDGDIVKRGSRVAARLNVGEPQFELLNPIVLGEKDGALEPENLPNGASELTAPRPTDNPSKTKDIVTYTWEGEVTGKKEDSITLNALTANKNVKFKLNADFVKDHIEPNRGKKVTASYRILRFETDSVSYSNPLEFTVGKAAAELLPPAKVLQAIDDLLDPANSPATVSIEANRPENAGDHFYMTWATTDGTTVHTDDVPITGSMQGKTVEFSVVRTIIEACLNKDVTVSYRVVLFEGGESAGEDYSLRVERQTSTLPVATLREATGEQKDQINPDNVYPDGATVVIPATAQLKKDDVVTVTVVGKTTVPYTHSVLEAEADKELAVIKVAHAFIAANLDDNIDLSYTVKRKAGSTDGPSNLTVYDVRKVVASGKLKVMGARFSRSTYRASSALRVLSAFNIQTGLPIRAEWKYPTDTQWTTAATWRDSQPQEPLQVRSANDQLTLNPANIIGNGVDTTVTGLAAFVAHRDIGDMVGWGNATYGGTIPSTIITMDDIVEVSCTRSAYAARRANSAVVVWGTPAEGGTMPGVDPLNFVQVVGNSQAFAGIKNNGSVVAWGTATSGATVPDPIKLLTDITHVIAAGEAFAALRNTGQVVAWGLAANGATVPPEIGGFTDIKTVIGSFGAFAAHRANGRIVGWGHATYGGTVPEAIAALTDVVELSCANAQAFTARRAAGQVVAWGTATYGGTVDSLIGGLTDIVEVCATWRAFAARRSNGHVVAWGTAVEGGSVPADIATLDDIVQVCGSSTAFAALRKNGTVVAWGNATAGGDTTPVVEQLTNVLAIYDNTHGFCALTSDGRVVTWGQAAGGGDSSAVQDRLKGKVSYHATPASRGMALNAVRNSDTRNQAAEELKPASVDEAVGNVLDPHHLPLNRAKVRIKPYDLMKYKDKVTLFFNDKPVDFIPISQLAVGLDVVFTVAAQTFIANAIDSVVLVRYEVQFEGAGTPQKSLNLALTLTGDFKTDALLDLSGKNYVAAIEKPPMQVPDYARMTRIANWGSAPHTFSIDNTDIAYIDERSGEVTVRTNGECRIIATDNSSPAQTQSYKLTIKGVQTLYYLGSSFNWEGMETECVGRDLEPVLLPQIERFWNLYKPGLTGGFGEYLNWPHYQFWTGTSIGAGTVSIYDLEGSLEEDKASSSSTEEQIMFQALGIYRP